MIFKMAFNSIPFQRVSIKIIHHRFKVSSCIISLVSEFFNDNISFRSLEIYLGKNRFLNGFIECPRSFVFGIHLLPQQNERGKAHLAGWRLFARLCRLYGELAALNHPSPTKRPYWNITSDPRATQLNAPWGGIRKRLLLNNIVGRVYSESENVCCWII